MSNGQLTIQTTLNASNLYGDSRIFGYQGPTRNVRLPRATPGGGGSIAKSEDGVRCAVTGKESLRLISLSDGSGPQAPGHKSSVGRGGYRIDASRNYWEGSGLKIDSTSTDIAWGRGVFSNKILTSARNGELIVWDLNKSGTSKYERRSKDHKRSIHAMSVSHIVHHYCITGSADGDMRVWDLRDLSQSLMRIHHPTSVRSVVFSPSTWQPLQAIVGLDNGSIYRWDLKMGQRGLLDRLPVAHTTSVTTFDWCNLPLTLPGPVSDAAGTGLGWLVSGGLDRTVKVWDLTAPGSTARMPSKPTYTLHPSFPVRHVMWRPEYSCELAVVSNLEFAATDLGQNTNLNVGADMSDIVGADVGRGGVEDTHLDQTLICDSVQIWDVRRAWIPKWSLTGLRDGVTDMVFGDSDVIWAQRSSGTFSQNDLRDCIKSLDLTSSTAVTWEASGSLAFVTGQENPWQIPYDDVHPERRSAADKLHLKPKALGDARYVSTSQDMGTIMRVGAAEDLEAFKKLAQGYIIEGHDRPTICIKNSQVALEEGDEQAAQTWLLLGASLSECMPGLPTPPLRTSISTPASRQKSPIPFSLSVPSSIPNHAYAFPSSASAPPGSTQLRKPSPSHTSTPSADSPHVRASARSVSSSRKMTPVSSKSSSPRQGPVALPTPRRLSVFGGREALESDFLRRGSISLLRRPSIITPSLHSSSPGEKGGGGGSLRHVGEGALDDSDSSSESGSGDSGDASSDEGGSSDGDRPLPSPILSHLRVMPTPSPLSQVAGRQHWTEDEGDGGEQEYDDEDDESPSPGSTDTDSESSSSPRQPRQRKSSGSSSSKAKRQRKGVKSRSRSSTVALLAAPVPPRLTHQHSSGSVRTVTAGERELEREEHVLKGMSTSRDVRGGAQAQTRSELGLDAVVEDGDGAGIREHDTEVTGVDPTRLTDRLFEIIRADEKRFREIAWNALRKALEDFADEGDVQMCTMLALIAPEELRISKRRVIRFIDAYIELLMRRRLYSCAAYLRKFCLVESVRQTTLVDTIIYTTCGQCRKPLIAPAGSRIPGHAVKGGYSYCITCKSSCAVCAICRLPVRTLLFHCSICSHGGHQACYRSYYAQRQMIDLPRSSVPPPAISSGAPGLTSRTGSGSTDEESGSTSSTFNSSTFDSSADNTSSQGRLIGRPCAAGCGHFCWIANAILDES